MNACNKTEGDQALISILLIFSLTFVGTWKEKAFAIASVAAAKISCVFTMFLVFTVHEIIIMRASRSPIPIKQQRKEILCVVKVRFDPAADAAADAVVGRAAADRARSFF